MTKNFLSSYWLSVLFCLSLLFFSMIVFAYIPSSNLAFCAEDDKTLIVCFRNWTNGAGNLLTAIVATVAAFFAFRQWKASDKQVSAAVLQPLEQRLQQIVQAHKIITDVYAEYSVIMRNSVEFYNKISVSEIDLKLSEIGVNAYNAEDRLKNLRSILDFLAVDLKYDDDICNIMSQALSLSHLDDSDDLELLYELMIVAGNRRYFDSQRKLETASEMKSHITLIEAAKVKIVSRHSRISELCLECVKLAQQVKDRRLEVLALR